MIASFTLQEEELLCRGAGVEEDTGHRLPHFKLEWEALFSIFSVLGKACFSRKMQRMLQKGAKMDVLELLIL